MRAIDMLLRLALTAAAVVALGGADDPARLEQYALTHDGDPVRGGALFRDGTRTACLTCHKVDGEGGDVGPDLSAVGGKFGRPHLVESLLEPSRQVVEGYRTAVIATADGRVFTGVVKERTERSLTLAGADGKRTTVDLADVDERRDGELSLMPEGLADTLSAEEFTDLVAFLESRRPGGRGTPGSGVSGGVTLPEGFRVKVVATGLTGATAVETTPDGRVLVCEQTGTLRVVKRGRLLPAPALALEVDSTWERGLIGVTVGPNFPTEPDLYVCYVSRSPYPHHRVSRFTMRGDVADPSSERVLLEGDDQRKLGGRVPAGHQGGALHFGRDGMLYVGVGEQTAGTPAQRLDTFQGKLLRVAPDGRVPDDNPFDREARGKYRAVWARGLRNPFTFAVRKRDGVMYINDIGEDRFEEVNRGVAGGNYGWPLAEGPTDDPRLVSPVYWYPHASVCGADFAPEEGPWARPYGGKYFFGEYIQGWIKTLDPDRPGRPEPFASGLRNLVDLRFSPDGGLYVLLRNAWVIDGKFQPGTGSLLRIAPPAAEGPP